MFSIDRIMTTAPGDPGMSRSHLKRWLAFLFLITMVPTILPGESPDGAVNVVQRRRLPNYYGQIGISDRQRERIYTLQGEYNSQIDDLQSRIDELKAERDAEIEAVLTDAQRNRLEDRREEARLAREARRTATQ